MKHPGLIVLLSLSLHIPLFAQTYWSRSFELEPSNEGAWNMEISEDTLYLMTWAFCPGLTDCEFLVRMDLDGNLLASTKYYFDGKNFVTALRNGMVRIKNGLMTGGTSRIKSTYNRPYLMRLNTQGDTLWRRDFGDSLDYNENIATILADPLQDRVYFSTQVVLGPNQYIGKLYAIDTTGQMIWQQILGVGSNIYNIYGLSLASDSLFLGSALGWIPNNDNNFIDYFAFDREGQIHWTIHKPEVFFDIGNSFVPYLAPHSDSSFVGNWYEERVWLQHEDRPFIFAMDFQGDTLWKTPLFMPFTQIVYKYLYRLAKLRQGDILVVGEESASPAFANGSWGGFAARLSPDGKLLWDRYFYDKTLKYYDEPCGFNDFAEDKEGNLYFCGDLMDTVPGVSPKQFNKNIWVVKVGPDGCIEPGCLDSVIFLNTHNTLLLKDSRLKVFPNPSSGRAWVEWHDLPDVRGANLRVFDLSGRLISNLSIRQKEGREELGLQGLPPGAYILQLFGNDWLARPEQLIIGSGGG